MMNQLIKVIDEIKEAQVKKNKILTCLKLSKLYKELEKCAKSYNLTIDDLKAMADELSHEKKEVIKKENDSIIVYELSDYPINIIKVKKDIITLVGFGDFVNFSNNSIKLVRGAYSDNVDIDTKCYEIKQNKSLLDYVTPERFDKIKLNNNSIIGSEYKDHEIFNDLVEVEMDEFDNKLLNQVLESEYFITVNEYGHNKIITAKGNEYKLLKTSQTETPTKLKVTYINNISDYDAPFEIVDDKKEFILGKDDDLKFETPTVIELMTHLYAYEMVIKGNIINDSKELKGKYKDILMKFKDK